MTTSTYGFVLVEPKPFQIFFLNNGAACLQLPDYCHLYADMGRMAEDYLTYQQDGDTSAWDGNEPEYRGDYDVEEAMRGGYVHADQHDGLESLRNHGGWANIGYFVGAIDGCLA